MVFPCVLRLVTSGHDLEGGLHVYFVHGGKAKYGGWAWGLNEGVVNVIPGDALCLALGSEIFKGAFWVVPPAKKIGANFGVGEGECAW